MQNTRQVYATISSRFVSCLPVKPSNELSTRGLATKLLDETWSFAAAKNDFLQRATTLQAMKLPRGIAPPQQQKSPNKPSSYATLVPLVTVNGTPCIVFTLRSSSLYKHRGEISFPGGKSDPADKDLIDTALREAEEEIGLARSRVQVWGMLPAMPTTRDRQGAMTAVVADCGEIKTEDDLVANVDEVEAIFVCSLNHLIQNNGYTAFRDRIMMPMFRTGRELDHRNIWGMTGVVLESVLRSLVPELYPHRRVAVCPVMRPDLATKKS